MNIKKSFFVGVGSNIIILGFVSLFTDISSQMVFPLIPLFLTSVIGASASVIGIIEGAAETTASLFKVISGYLSDKTKQRKRFILFGYSLSTLIKPLFAFANVWFLILFIRVLERIGKGIRNAPRDAIVAESCDKSARGRAYGFHRAMDGLGSVIGAILAFILLPLIGYKNIFLFAFIPGIIAVFIILFIKEKHIPLVEKKEKYSFNLSIKSLSSNLKLFILVSSIFALGRFGYAFLLLRANNLGFADKTSISLYILFYIVYIIFSIPSGMLSDKFGRKLILIISYLIFAVISIILIFVSSMLGLIISFIIYGIFYAMIDGAQRAFVVDLAPKKFRGTALGVFHTAVGLVALPGGFIAGLLWDNVNPMATFVYAFILTLVSLFLFIFIIKNDTSDIH